MQSVHRQKGIFPQNLSYNDRASIERVQTNTEPDNGFSEGCCPSTRGSASVSMLV